MYHITATADCKLYRPGLLLLSFFFFSFYFISFYFIILIFILFYIVGSL